MKNYLYLRTILIVAVLLFSFSMSNSYSGNLLFKSYSQPAASQASNSKLSAITTENTIVIDYKVDKTQNSYIVISDMLGNKLRVIRINSTKGKINLKLSDLEQAGGTGVYKCTIFVDGNQILSQPISVLSE